MPVDATQIVHVRLYEPDSTGAGAGRYHEQCGFVRVPTGTTIDGLEIPVTSVKLQIQYCGGCNPEIDRASLVAHLKQLIESAGLKPILCKDDQADWVILVNGCARACLEEQFPESRRRPRRISVQGSNFDYRPVAENELPRTVWETIRKL